MNSKPPPDPKQIYPDAEKISANLKKETRRSRFRSFLSPIFVALILIGAVYWFYNSDFLKENKSNLVNQVNDENLQRDLARVQPVASFYYSGYRTFVGLDQDTDVLRIADTINKHGSGLVIKGLGEKTFVAYVYLPYSKKYHCLDATGFLGNVEYIDPIQTSCQR